MVEKRAGIDSERKVRGCSVRWRCITEVEKGEQEKPAEVHSRNTLVRYHDVETERHMGHRRLREQPLRGRGELAGGLLISGASHDEDSMNSWLRAATV